MGKFDGMLICTDLDGTLLKTVSNEEHAIARVIHDLELGKYNL